MSYNELSSAEQDILLELYERYNNDTEILFADDINDFPTKPYGGSNPYHYCKHCHTSIIDISINNNQHLDSFPSAELINAIRFFLEYYLASIIYHKELCPCVYTFHTLLLLSFYRLSKIHLIYACTSQNVRFWFPRN